MGRINWYILKIHKSIEIEKGLQDNMIILSRCS